MRLMKVAATVGVAVAMFLGSAGTGSAAQNDFSKPMPGVPGKDSGISAQRTNGNHFWEVNSAGELVYWYAANGTYGRQVRGSGWDEAHTLQITSLNENVFIELKADYRLSRWTWTGNGFIEEVVGTNWTPTRLLTGIDDNRFLEVKHDGQLVQWTFHGTTLAPYHIGVGWEAARLIAGLGGPEDDEIDFLEVKHAAGAVSNWYGTVGNLVEWPIQGADFTNVRLIAGLDSYNFIMIPADGTLWHVTVDEAQEAWVGYQVGQGWNGTRLIG